MRVRAMVVAVAAGRRAASVRTKLENRVERAKI